jgi:hypothetical protein
MSDPRSLFLTFALSSIATVGLSYYCIDELVNSFLARFLLQLSRMLR